MQQLSEWTYEHPTKAYEAYNAGCDLSDREAEELESRLTAEPGDQDSRIRLLGFYESSDGRQHFAAHLKYMIEVFPDSAVHDLISYPDDDEYFNELCKLWDENPTSPVKLHLFARFCELVDPRKSINLWSQAAQIDSQNPQWQLEILLITMREAHYWSERPLQPHADQALEQMNSLCVFVQQFPERRAKLRRNLFSVLYDVVELALKIGNFAQAKHFAEVYRTLPPLSLSNKSVREHTAFALQGRAALSEGNRSLAKTFLSDMCERDIPALAFGRPVPDLTLANCLSAVGETSAVSAFLRVMKARIEVYRNLLRDENYRDIGFDPELLDRLTTSPNIKTVLLDHADKKLSELDVVLENISNKT